jgi:hypothetical protein
MTPKQYLELKRQKESEIATLRAEIEEAWMESNRTPRPENLRPAEARDIVLGAVIWYNVGPDDYYPTEWGWFEVEEVLRPSDDWKAFTTDGCRRGLYGAFVENADVLAPAGEKTPNP